MPRMPPINSLPGIQGMTCLRILGDQSKEWILGKFKASPILDAACKKVLSTYLFMRVWGMFHLLAKCWQGQADLTFIKLEISIPYCMDSMFSYPITISIL